MTNRGGIVVLTILVTLWAVTTANNSVAGGLSAQFLGQLQPTGMPAGLAYGGGGNSFERRVDVSGNLAVVGAGLFRQGADQGYAFVFDLSNTNNIQQIATLRASDNSSGNEFGDGVAISGNRVFVGARGDSGNRGAVYMYDVSNPNSVVQRKITAFDAAPNNEFGFSLSVDGNRLLVGAPKFTASSLPPAAYVVDISNPNNFPQGKIVQNPLGSGGNYAEQVSISGNYAIVGHISDSTEVSFGGSAHLYDISGLNPAAERRLKPTDAPNYSQFGGRVSISGTKALVNVSSDPGPSDLPGAPDGTVWAFDFSDWNNIKQHEFGRPIDTFPPAPFGRWLELQGNLAVAGAFNEGAGAVYLYDVANIFSPVQLLRIAAPSSSGGGFGVSFAVDKSTLLVSDNWNHVYAYRIVPEPAAAFTLASALAFATLALSRRRPSAPTGS